MTPDAEWVVITWLRQQPDITAPIDTEYPGTPTAVVIERIGGTADYLGVVDHPRLDVGIWAPTKAQAVDLMTTVRTAVHAINGQVVADAACGSVSEVMGPRSLTDESTELSRYLFTVEITMRAVVAQ